MKPNDIEDIYRTVPLEEIPWNFETPPNTLVVFVETRKVMPCKTINLGCGEGYNAIYLASRGFNVTGIDISPTAIRFAKEKAKKEKVTCVFVVDDVLCIMNEVKDTFDFAYDWSLLHHIYPVKRKQYIENVNRILNSKGKYLSVCLSEKDPHFDSSGKYRKTPLETVLYFSSEEELKKLFSTYFEILEMKTIEIRGKFTPNIANYVLMQKI